MFLWVPFLIRLSSFQVMNILVLSIVVTAPLGAIAISVSARYLLKRSEPSSESIATAPTQQEAIELLDGDVEEGRR